MKKYLGLALILVLFSCKNDDGDDTVDTCLVATNIQVNDITTTSATITWNDFNTADSYIIEHSISGFSIGSGTTSMATTTSANLSNLGPDTTYDVYIQVACSTNNLSSNSEVFSFTTDALPVIAEFRQTLSELNLFSGNLSDLNITSKAFKYELSTQLFSDYAHKQRFIALPEGTSMTYDGDGLPIFPDNTVIAKTFYYNDDERDLSLGRTIIETRLLIKIDGSWETGNYIWNEGQTEAFLDTSGSTLPISWINANGETNSINYEIPSSTDCFSCHNSYSRNSPIGPKLRSMNFEINGTNQLEQFIANGQLTGVSNSSSVGSLPNWEDTSLSLEDRARAYIDMNCASCHIPGGDCFGESTLNLAYERSLEESLIDEQSTSIELRITSNINGIKMPLIGTTILHTEGVQLIQDYLNSLD